MVSEIHIEGIGIMRHLNDWQLARLNRVRRDKFAETAAAYGLGMTVYQFKRLSPEDRAKCVAAFNKLLSPPPFTRRASLR